MNIIHFRRLAREWAMQFLFQYDSFCMENRDKSINFFISQLGDSDIFAQIEDDKLFRKASRTTAIYINETLDHLEKIDEIISEYSTKWKLNRMDVVDKNIMRIAVYEMLFCQNIPPIVSINEAVEIGKTYGTDNTALFINGVLNAIKNSLDRSPRIGVKEA